MSYALRIRRLIARPRKFRGSFFDRKEPFRKGIIRMRNRRRRTPRSDSRRHSRKRERYERRAYRNDEKWYWSLDDCEVNVEITAWKKKCEPYKAE